MKTIMLENISETAYRFSPVIKFLPGEKVTVTEQTIDSYPSIGLLMERGILKEVGAWNEPEVKAETEKAEEPKSDEKKVSRKGKGRKKKAETVKTEEPEIEGDSVEVAGFAPEVAPETAQN